MIQYFIRTFRPKLYGLLTKIVYVSSKVKIGKNFRCDSIPRILIDKNGVVEIGDNVEFRRNVEIRCHLSSKICIHDNVRIDRGVRILSNNSAIIRLDEGVRVGLYTVINGGDSVLVGAKSLISGFVYLQTSMHNYSSPEMDVQGQGYSHAPIKLGYDSWLGTHVVVLPGVSIGKGSIIGSNSVVTKKVDEFQVFGGVPAKLLKERK